MMSKKAQSQIITTVLIILLVLAAIVIVWQVVNTTVRGGAEEVERQSKCLGATLEITNYDSSSVTVKNTGTKKINGVRIYVAGSLKNSSTADLASGATYETDEVGDISDGDSIEAAAVVDGVVCPAYASEVAEGLS